MTLAFILLFCILLVFSVYIGFLIGQAVCASKVTSDRSYWIANAAGVAVMLAVVVLAAALPMLYAVAFGCLAGYIAGLKMTFKRSVGFWKLSDKFFNARKGPKKKGATARAEKAKGASSDSKADSAKAAPAKRSRAGKGAPASDKGGPEHLISVDTEGPAAPARKGSGKGGAR